MSTHNYKITLKYNQHIEEDPDYLEATGLEDVPDGVDLDDPSDTRYDYTIVVSADSSLEAVKSVLNSKPFSYYLGLKYHNMEKCESIIDPQGQMVEKGVNLNQAYLALLTVQLFITQHGEGFVHQLEGFTYFSQKLYANLYVPLFSSQVVKSHFTVEQFGKLEAFAHKYEKYYELFCKLIKAADEPEELNLNDVELQKMAKYEMQYGSIVVEPVD